MNCIFYVNNRSKRLKIKSNEKVQKMVETGGITLFGHPKSDTSVSNTSGLA